MLTQTQQAIWEDRYALRDEKGEVTETSIRQTWNRVAEAIGEDEPDKDSYYQLLKDFKFIPGGRILAGAGAESQKTFYNCYVIPVESKARRENRSNGPYFRFKNEVSAREYDAACRALEEWVKDKTRAIMMSEDIELISIPQEDNGNDSREAIFDTISTMVSIMSRGGGVGINWSTLRPRDSYLNRVSGHSSGPVGWMDVASTAVGEVIQGGSRRGAAMFMLDIWHPDVLSFINAKRDNSKITNANISVGVSDPFMKALEEGSDWTFIFPDTTHPEYDKSWDGDIEDWQARGLPVVEHGTVPASGIWEQISSSAHASGEPGVIFLDRYNELSTANGRERIICVNPCGEQGLGAYSVCNLGAMNLYAYIQHEMTYSDMGPELIPFFDLKSFDRDVRTAIRFLDDVIDRTPDYLPETRKRQEDLRRIGLGVMGLADALVALGYRYGGDLAQQFTSSVFQAMKDAAIEESMELAKEKGAAGAWSDDLASRPYLAEYTERTGNPITPMRNLFLLTQAPTGTTSLLAGVNSGIEPFFAIRTWREDRTGGRWVYPAGIADTMGWDEDTDGSFDLPLYLVTAKDVTVDEHIAMQAVVQRYVDSSVSKTINAPSDQPVEETARAFTKAYASGLKGIAYYRDGSREKQVLYSFNPNERIAGLEQQVAELQAKLAFKERAASTAITPIMLAIPVAQGSDCPSCENGVMVYEEGCQKCYQCGWSAC